jgi:hypothetical protein
MDALSWQCECTADSGQCCECSNHALKNLVLHMIHPQIIAMKNWRIIWNTVKFEWMIDYIDYPSPEIRIIWYNLKSDHHVYINIFTKWFVVFTAIWRLFWLVSLCLRSCHHAIKLQYLDCEHAIQGSISPQIFLFQAIGPLANTSFVKMQIHFCWYLLAQSPEEFLIIWSWCPEVVVVVAWIMLSLWSFFHVTNLYLKWVSKLPIRSRRKPWTTCTNSNFLVRTQMH